MASAVVRPLSGSPELSSNADPNCDPGDLGHCGPGERAITSESSANRKLSRNDSLSAQDEIEGERQSGQSIGTPLVRCVRFAK
jgi:hypothetical protein